MTGRGSSDSGFTLVELIAVVVILGVLAAVVASRFAGNDSVQLQTARDQLVAALHLAQQRAMAQASDVRVVLGTNQVDVQQEHAGVWQSVTVGNVRYPVDISPSVVTPHALEYNRLGQTEDTTISLSHGTASVEIEVSKSGFSH